MTTSGTTVGFLGLGRMGAPMATRLLGHDPMVTGRLQVYDKTAAAVGALVA